MGDLPDDFQIGSKSGVLGYTEFLAAMLDRPGLQEDICYSAFRMFDKDGDNKISKDEVRIVFKNIDIQEAACNDTVSKIMNEVNLKGDGMIDFPEFRAMLRK